MKIIRINNTLINLEKVKFIEPSVFGVEVHFDDGTKTEISKTNVDLVCKEIERNVVSV